jgi:RNA polymerase sigma-70 factor (ECF subfamily)
MTKNESTNESTNELSGVDFARACAAHRAELLGTARRLCRSRDGAEDLVQEVLLRALLNASKFRPGAGAGTTGNPLGAWLQCILRNEFINRYRTTTRHARLLEARPVDARDALHSADSRAADPRSVVIWNAGLSTEAAAAVGRLRPDHRDLVERADLRGETYAVISAATGMPMGTVMSRLHRARRALADDLRELARRDYGLRAAEAE